MKFLRLIFNIDNLLVTILVFLMLKYCPYIFQIDFLNPIQNTMNDFDVANVVFSRFNDKDKVGVDSNIVIVNIGYLKRDSIAAQIEILNRWNPKVIAVDAMFFSHKSHNVDSVFAAALSKVKNLVLASKLLYNENIEEMDESDPQIRFRKDSVAISEFCAYGKSGYATLNVDTIYQEVVRDFYPQVNINNQQLTSFAVSTASIYDSVKTSKFLSRKNQIEIINFQRNIDKYPTLDWKYVFEHQDSLSFIKDKIILLGFLGPNLKKKTLEDIFFTPMNEKYIGRTHPDMYGVVVHANIISMILDGKFYNKNSKALSLFFCFLLIYSNICLFYMIRHKDVDLYESLSLLFISIELILFWTFLIMIMSLFRFELNIAGDFYVLLLLTISFEFYHESFKPLTLNAYNKIKFKFRKKRIQID